MKVACHPLYPIQQSNRQLHNPDREDRRRAPNVDGSSCDAQGTATISDSAVRGRGGRTASPSSSSSCTTPNSVGKNISEVQINFRLYFTEIGTTLRLRFSKRKSNNAGLHRVIRHSVHRSCHSNIIAKT